MIPSSDRNRWSLAAQLYRVRWIRDDAFEFRAAAAYILVGCNSVSSICNLWSSNPSTQLARYHSINSEQIKSSNHWRKKIKTKEERNQAKSIQAFALSNISLAVLSCASLKTASTPFKTAVEVRIFEGAICMRPTERKKETHQHPLHAD